MPSIDLSLGSWVLITISMRLFESYIPVLQMPRKSLSSMGFAICLLHELQIDGLFPSNQPYISALKQIQGVSVLK